MHPFLELQNTLSWSFVGSTATGCLFIFLTGGDDVPKLEPIRSLHYTRVDKIVRDLRRIYKENPAYFDVPAFAQKVY